MAAQLTFLGPVRQGGGATVVLTQAPAYAGLSWRVVAGSGSISGAMAHADAGGAASARYDASGAVEGEAVTVEVDIHA